MKPLRFLLAILSLFALNRLVAQTPDDFNPGASPTGNGVVNSIAVQVDGKILVGGFFTTLGGRSRNNIARLNTDGSLDTSFNPGAINDVNSLVVQADGKILVGGSYYIVRLNGDGTLDSNFNLPAVNFWVHSLAVQEDGKILVGGNFTTLGGQTRNRIARLNADGSLDAGFNPGADALIYSLALQADGKILVGGQFTTLGGQTRNRIARLNADGSLDSSFNPGANNYVYCLSVQVDGKILVGGFFTTLAGQPRNRIARLNPDGSLDAGFNPDANSGVESMFLQADGKILAGGTFTTLGGQSRDRIARLNTDGSLDTGFNPGADAYVASLAVQVDGKILVGGQFTTLGSQSRTYIARLNNNIAASQTLTLSGTSQIDWTRGGSAPEVEQVTFESWNGSAWVSQGVATRVSGGWRKTGLSLPASGWIRTSGRASGGRNSGTSYLVAQVASYGIAAFPDIAVTATGGSSLVSSAGKLDFGSVTYAAPSVPPQSITITNAGDGVLSDLAVSIAGGHAADFTVGALATTTLAPGQSTTLQVGFTAQGGGLRGAELRITSNDLDESPFLINLQGYLIDVEPDFNPGASSNVLSFSTQADGKILVGGQFTTFGGQTRNRIARLNADGSLDTGFNPAAGNIVNALAAQTDGKILLGGSFTTLGGQSRSRIGRLNADGSLDTAFNPGASSTVNSLAIQADGKIIAGGNFSTMGGQTRSFIGRLDADGSLDASFNPGAGSQVLALAMQSDGKILVGGLFTTLGGQTRNRIGRLNADGSLDTGFNPDANGDVYSLVVQADGKILVAGNFTTLGGQPRDRIARLNADGSLDNDFNPGASNIVYSLALQSDGKILVGGNFTTLGGQTRNYIGRLNADGSLDSGLNPGAGSTVRSLALQADGRILVGGSFTTLGGQTRNRIARLNNNIAASQALTVSGTSQIDWTRGGSAPEVEQVTFESWNGSAWVSQGPATRVAGGWRVTGLSLPTSGWIRATGRATGGQFNGSSGIIVQVAGYGSGLPDIAVTGAGETPLASGTGMLDFGAVVWPQTSTPLSITITNAGEGVLSGLAVNITGTNAADFTAGTLATTTLAPGQSTSLQVDFVTQAGGSRSAELRIMSNDADETPFVINLKGMLSYADPGFNPDANGDVYAMAMQADDKILMGGTFTTVGGVTRNQIARLNADETLDNSFNPNVNGVYSLALQADDKILMGGVFTTVGGVTRNRIARLNADGTLDNSFNPNVNGGVRSLAVQVDGKIVMGGAFTTVGGVTRNRIARLNADGTLDSSFNPDTSGVSSVALQADGKILMGGEFTTVGGETRNRIARLNADGTLDTFFNPNANHVVISLAVQPDGKIVVGGLFTTLGGETRNRIARLNADGSLDSSFNPNANNSVNSLALQADGKILIGGDFTTVGGETRNRIARLNADGTLDSSLNPGAGSTVYSLALQADGRILVGGSFTTLGGQTRNRIARLNNDIAASQALTVTGTSQIDWARGSSAPEVEQVTFEGWNGSAWVSQGTATRVSGGWRNTGLSLPASGWIRAKGRASGGLYNGSSGLIEQINSYGSALPDIAVEDAIAGELISGGTGLDFGSHETGSSTQRVLTIRNAGTATLSGLASTASGTGFSVSSPALTSLAPGESTTCTFSFSPGSAGAFSGSVSIASNDADETPFVIALSGSAYLPPEIALEQPAGTNLLTGATSTFGTVLTGQTLPRIFTIRNTGTGTLNLGAITVTGTNTAAFALTTAGTTPSLAPGASTTLLVVFQPTTGGAKTATVTITNNDANENPFLLNLSGTGNTPPVFSGYSVSTAYQTAVTLSLSKLLTAASDADGHALSVTAAGPSSAPGGTAVLGSGILYTPPAGFSGTDTFPVTITDTLGATVNGTVTVTVGAAPGGGGSTLNPPQVTVQPNGKPKIAFQGIPGRTYRVERTTNFSTWTTLANVTASPTGQVEYTDENPPPGGAFYRIARP